MKKTPTGTLEVVTSCALLLLACSVLFLLFPDFRSQDVAAWAQAIGSVLALIGAFAIANRQVLEQRRQQDEKDAREADRIASFASAAAAQTAEAISGFARSIHIRIPDNKPYFFDTRRLDAAADLVGISLNMALPTELIQLMANMHKALLNTRAVAEQLEGTIDSATTLEMRVVNRLAVSLVKADADSVATFAFKARERLGEFKT